MTPAAEVMMLKLELDLDTLTAEELAAAERALHREALAAPAQLRGEHHEELQRLFTALEHAVHEEAASRHALEERHRIAEALGVDEETGEWLAGA